MRTIHLKSVRTGDFKTHREPLLVHMMRATLVGRSALAWEFVATRDETGRTGWSELHGASVRLTDWARFIRLLVEFARTNLAEFRTCGKLPSAWGVSCRLRRPVWNHRRYGASGQWGADRIKREVVRLRNSALEWSRTYDALIHHRARLYWLRDGRTAAFARLPLRHTTRSPLQRVIPTRVASRSRYCRLLRAQVYSVRRTDYLPDAVRSPGGPLFPATHRAMARIKKIDCLTASRHRTIVLRRDKLLSVRTSRLPPAIRVSREMKSVIRLQRRWSGERVSWSERLRSINLRCGSRLRRKLPLPLTSQLQRLLNHKHLPREVA